MNWPPVAHMPDGQIRRGDQSTIDAIHNTSDYPPQTTSRWGRITQVYSYHAILDAAPNLAHHTGPVFNDFGAKLWDAWIDYRDQALNRLQRGGRTNQKQA